MQRRLEKGAMFGWRAITITSTAAATTATTTYSNNNNGSSSSSSMNNNLHDARLAQAWNYAADNCKELRQSASQHNLQSVSVAAPATFFWHRQRRSTILKAQSRSSQRRLQSYVPDCFFCSHHKSLYASCASKLQNPYTPHTSSSEDYAHTEDDRNEAADASWVEAFALVCIHAF